MTGRLFLVCVKQGQHTYVREENRVFNDINVPFFLEVNIRITKNICTGYCNLLRLDGSYREKKSP